MKTRFISLACWLSAIIITIALSVFAAYWGWFPIFALASIIWAALDSRRVRLWRYHTGISGGPVTIFILLLVLGWPVVFPWYLGMRMKIGPMSRGYATSISRGRCPTPQLVRAVWFSLGVVANYDRAP
jgi:hypothetical protein